MTTKDHKILGKYLIRQSGGFEKAIYEKAFVLGSVEPDYNIFTYLKGSIKHRLFMGHNFNSSLNYLKKAASRLKRKDKANWNVFDYYKLGKIVHYIADDFTHPHNENFVGDLFEHCVYEFELHRYLVDYIKQNEIPNYKRLSSDSLTKILEKSHDEYLLSFPSPVEDCKWITEMTWQALNWFFCTNTVSEFSMLFAAA